MAGVTCGWRRCEQPARLAVLIGEVFEAADVRGVYCVRHATIKRRVLEQEAPAPIWLDWTQPARPRRRLVGQGPPQRTLHRHVRARLGSRS